MYRVSEKRGNKDFLETPCSLIEYQNIQIIIMYLRVNNANVEIRKTLNLNFIK